MHLFWDPPGQLGRPVTGGGPVRETMETTETNRGDPDDESSYRHASILLILNIPVKLVKPG